MNAEQLNNLLIRPAQEDDYAKISDFLLESSDLYPDIEFWWQNRVRPTFEEGKRVVLVVDSGMFAFLGCQKTRRSPRGSPNMRNRSLLWQNVSSLGAKF